MLPILFKFGPFAIYSFGLFLAIAVVVASFFVWRKSRENALSDEKMIDIFILSLVSMIAAGRLFYVLFNWQVFRSDLGRVVLFLKYPGISFSAGLLFAGMVAALLARANGLSAWMLLDIFSLALSAASIFGFLGCFLDGCMGKPSGVPLILSAVMLLLTVFLSFVWTMLKNSIAFAKFVRKSGVIFLSYLIFSSLSLLISSYISGRTGTPLYFGALILSVFVLAVRYRSLIWSSFPVQFYPKLRSILKREGSK